MSNHSDQDLCTDDIDEGDIDEDEILASLSPEELKQLQSEMDDIAPDEKVPVGQRQKDQTEKTPTGSFDHRSLTDYLYWEKESNRMLEEERKNVTLLPSEKSMKLTIENEINDQRDNENKEKEDNAEDVEYVYEVVEEVIEEEVADGDEGEEVIEEIIEEIVEVVEEDEEEEEEEEEYNEVEQENEEKKEENKVEVKDEVKKPINVEQNATNEHLKNSADYETHTANNTNSPQQPPPELAETKEEKEPETSEHKVSTTEISEDVYTNSVDSVDTPRVTEQASQEQRTEEMNEKIPPKEEKKIGKLNIPKLALGGIKMTSRPSGNETNLDTTLDKMRKNNPAITDVNLNNIENIPKDMLVEYVNALKKNKHVKTFSIANTGADENIAFTLANMLRENRSITTLNIESNFITGKGIIAIIRCLQFNETLTELRFHNQRHMLGHHAEMEVSRLLKANNTLLKMGYHFELPGPRMVVTNLLTRNLDHQRQQRNDEQKQQQKQQQMKDQKEMLQLYENTLNLPPGLLEMLGYVPPIELLQQLYQQQQQEQQQQEQQPCATEACPLKPNNTPPQARKQLKHTVQQRNPIPQPHPSANAANPLKDVQLKRVPKRRDPFLDLDPREDTRPGRANFQLRKTPRARDTGMEDERAGVDERANLKDVIKTLKPVPRRRQPAKVDPTPRDDLLSEIRQSNVAYLKSVPLPKELESRETSLF